LIASDVQPIPPDTPAIVMTRQLRFCGVSPEWACD
jgi:hypothetical protein